MDHIIKNKSLWDARTKVHVDSEFYDLKSFREGRSSLNPIELELLGDVKGKRILHLQCHFGQDSISLARMGASVVGVDLSSEAISIAQKLSNELKTECKFICCDIFDLMDHLDKKFDIVFTSYGVIGWLPELKTWGKLIANYLKQDGQFVIAEFHPTIWMYSDDLSQIQYSYFNAAPIVGKEEGSYADRNADLNLEYMVYNHSLASVFSNLLINDLRISHFNEYDYSPYKCWVDTYEDEPGRYRIKKFGKKMPLVFSLKALKE